MSHRLVCAVADRIDKETEGRQRPTARRENLHYAAADARAFGSQLVPRLQKTGQYSQVTFVPLVSDTDSPASGTLPATKAALRAALMALAGKVPDAQSAPFTFALQKMGVGKAAPEDMVLLAFSCHGDTDAKTGEYYLFPTDIGPDQSHGLTPDLQAHSISSAELTQWMQGVGAGEMAMVIDSCHSAAAAGQAFKPGPMDSPGLGQLAYYKRMRILSASQADAAAKEYADLGHGLLTAALVGDGLVGGGAKPAAGQTVLTVGPWLTFAEGDVPQLDARENGLKRPQAKHGLSGPPGHKGTEIVNGAVEAPNRGLQKPSLFDFHRAGAPDAAVSVGGGKAP